MNFVPFYYNGVRQYLVVNILKTLSVEYLYFALNCFVIRLIFKEISVSLNQDQGKQPHKANTCSEFEYNKNAILI